jgi:hypothetical protein
VDGLGLELADNRDGSLKIGVAQDGDRDEIEGETGRERVARDGRDLLSLECEPRALDEREVGGAEHGPDGHATFSFLLKLGTTRYGAQGGCGVPLTRRSRDVTLPPTQGLRDTHAHG